MDKIYSYLIKNICDDKVMPVEEKIDFIKLCIRNGLDLNYNDGEFLIIAITGNSNNYPIIKYFIDNGIDVQSRDNLAIIKACGNSYKTD